MALRPIIPGGFYNSGGGGATIPSVTNLIAGDGAGGAADSGIVPANVMLASIYDPAGIAAQVAGRTVANTFSGIQTITPTTPGTCLILTGGTVVTSLPILTGTQTWNDAGVTFIGESLAITNTASAAASKFFSYLGGAGGVTELAYLRIDGAMRLLKAYNATNYHIGDATGGIAWSTGDTYFIQGSAAQAAFVVGNGLIVRSTLQIGFTAGLADAGANDTFWTRFAANKFGCSTAANIDAAVVSTHTVRMAFNGVEYKVLVATP